MDVADNNQIFEISSRTYVHWLPELGYQKLCICDKMAVLMQKNKAHASHRPIRGATRRGKLNHHYHQFENAKWLWIDSNLFLFVVYVKNFTEWRVYFLAAS